MPDLLKYFNWVDLITLIFLVRGIYQGVKNGLIAEFFSLASWFVAIFFSFRFYKPIAAVIHQRTEIPLVINELAVFISIIIAAIIFTRIIFGVFKSIIRIKLAERINRAGGVILGLVKAAVVLSVLFYASNITSIAYLEKSIQEKSLSGKVIYRVSEVVYDNFTRFTPLERKPRSPR